MTVLSAARIVSGDGGVSAAPAFMVVEDGRIVSTGTGAAPADAVDLGDALLAPGFVDLQVNGFGSIDFATASVDELRAGFGELAAVGVTSCLATLVSAPLDSYAPAIERLVEAGAWGVHLEGPFLGDAPGAHPPDLLRPADPEWLDGLLDRFPGVVRMVTLAPEADPDFAATRLLAARGVVVALGHTTAPYEVARAGADAGATAVTHLFNGMGPFHHRAPGLPGAALTDRRLVPTLIADLVHVHPAVVQLVVQARPDAVLVSDAVGGIAARDGAAYLADGTLAGAVVPLSRGVVHVAALGASPGQAVRMATANPARVIAADDRGRIAPGCRADLVALDPDTLAVRAVWVSGVPLGS